MKYIIYQVDSFTKNSFEGNPAGVVLNSDGLSESQMQKIARELNNSETAFILSPVSDDHDVWVRFFTPRTEIPLCGHATIAAHYVRAVVNNLPSSTVIQKTGAGNLPVEIIKEEDDYKIIMTQGKISFEEPFSEPVREKIVKALGLVPTDLYENCPVQIVSAGHSKVLIGIKNRGKLDSITPDHSSLTLLSREIGSNGYFVFTFDSKDKDILTYGRMFAPAIGVNEDPVTGNAHGPLGAYIVRHRLAPDDGKTFCFKGRQGEAIGRAGTAEVEIEIKDGSPLRAKVGGAAQIVFRTEIELNNRF